MQIYDCQAFHHQCYQIDETDGYELQNFKPIHSDYPQVGHSNKIRDDYYQWSCNKTMHFGQCHQVPLAKT